MLDQALIGLSHSSVKCARADTSSAAEIFVYRTFHWPLDAFAVSQGNPKELSNFWHFAWWLCIHQEFLKLYPEIRILKTTLWHWTQLLDVSEDALVFVLELQVPIIGMRNCTNVSVFQTRGNNGPYRAKKDNFKHRKGGFSTWGPLGNTKFYFSFPILFTEHGFCFRAQFAPHSEPTSEKGDCVVIATGKLKQKKRSMETLYGSSVFIWLQFDSDPISCFKSLVK